MPEALGWSGASGRDGAIGKTLRLFHGRSMPQPNLGAASPGAGTTCLNGPMHIVIVGCGRVGSGLARNLEAEGHSVAIIDRNRKAFRRLPSDFKGIAVEGSGFDRNALHDAKIEEADAFAAVTSGDNSNILSARIARETFGVERVVARIYDPQRAQVYQRLGIPTVATVTWTVDQVRSWLLPDEFTPHWRDATGNLLLMDRVLPEHLAGQKLSTLEMKARSASSR